MGQCQQGKKAAGEEAGEKMERGDTVEQRDSDGRGRNQGFSLGFWSLPQMEFYSNNFFQLGKLVH